MAAERPIIFSGPMVRAILTGAKTQTRRVVKLPPRVTKRRGPHEILFYNTGSGQYPGGHRGYTGDQPPGLLVRCEGEGTVQRVPSPYGIPGGRLWVRETWAIHGMLFDDLSPNACASHTPDCFWYRASGKDAQRGRCISCQRGRWRPSIHMPRWASRLALEIVNVRVERLQAISESDAKAEGAPQLEGRVCDLAARVYGGPRWVTSSYHLFGFQKLWDGINAKREFGWHSNPWVWVVDFRRVDVNGAC